MLHVQNTDLRPLCHLGNSGVSGALFGTACVDRRGRDSAFSGTPRFGFFGHASIRPLTNKDFFGRASIRPFRARLDPASFFGQTIVCKTAHGIFHVCETCFWIDGRSNYYRGVTFHLEFTRGVNGPLISFG